MRHVVVTITGASGSVYGLRLVTELLKAGVRVTLLLTDAGAVVLHEECGIDWRGDETVVHRRMLDHFGVDGERLRHYATGNLLAPIASGSSAPDAMIVCPASMGTVARIACGLSTNLPERCADAMLKERRPLLLVPRETPLSEIHLKNLLRLSRAGAHIVPAMPAFYHRPATLVDLVDFVVGKALDVLKVEHDLFRRWGSEGGEQ